MRRARYGEEGDMRCHQDWMQALTPPDVQTNACDISVDFQSFCLISQVKDISRLTQNCLAYLPPGFTCEM